MNKSRGGSRGKQGERLAKSCGLHVENPRLCFQSGTSKALELNLSNRGGIHTPTGNGRLLDAERCRQFVL
jgi:hypothetical protein